MLVIEGYSESLCTPYRNITEAMSCAVPRKSRARNGQT